MKTLYTTKATATGNGRNGHAATDDGMLSLDMRVPKSMGGPGGATNPEQLFACGYAACFHSALKFGASIGLHDTTDSEVDVTVSLKPSLHGGFALAVEIAVRLPKLTDDAAITLAKRAHKYCPYSNATRGNVDVKLSANGSVVEL